MSAVMSRRTALVALVLVLGINGSARAQRLTRDSAPLTVSHESLGLSLTGSSVLADAGSDATSNLLWLDDPSTTQWRSLADLVDRLPLHQLQGFVEARPGLRWGAAVAGVGLMAVEQMRGTSTVYLRTVGIQALRFSLGGAFAPGGFHIEPSIGDGGFAVSFRKVT
jgi:hypothetical protein